MNANIYQFVPTRNSALAVGVVALFLGSAVNSDAVLLNTTGVFGTTPTAVVQPGVIVGNMTASYGPSVGGADTFFGDLQSIVVRRSGAAVIDGQAFNAGGLDFWIQIRMDFTNPPPQSNSTADNSRLTYSPFVLLNPGFISAEFLLGAVVPAGVAGFSTLTNGSAGAAGVPQTVQDSNSGVIGWDWTSTTSDNSMNLANPDSRWLVLHTNDTDFTKIGAGIQDGGVAPSQTYAPAVPEPTAGIFGVALTAMIGMVRRKRTA